jgi:hypothetical protein
MLSAASERGRHAKQLVGRHTNNTRHTIANACGQLVTMTMERGCRPLFICAATSTHKEEVGRENFIQVASHRIGIRGESGNELATDHRTLFSKHLLRAPETTHVLRKTQSPLSHYTFLVFFLFGFLSLAGDGEGGAWLGRVTRRGPGARPLGDRTSESRRTPRWRGAHPPRSRR